MKRSEAASEIVQAWDRWWSRQEKGTGNDAFAFFGWVEKERPDLLDLKFNGDKWQAVHGMLRHRQKVED